MKKVVLDFVNKLEGYKTAVKSLHWSSSNMSEHELFDKIADSVKDIQDVVSESEQGMTSPLANNKLKPIPYKITTSKKFLDDLSKTAIEFRNKINGDDYIGMRSAVEAFISEVDVFKYQLTICLKEDFERRMNRNRVRLTESQLHRVVKESVDSILEDNEVNKPFGNGIYSNRAHKRKVNSRLKGLRELAYKNQGMIEKIKEVAEFADVVARVAYEERDEYAELYGSISRKIPQMLNLWRFLDKNIMANQHYGYGRNMDLF